MNYTEGVRVNLTPRATAADVRELENDSVRDEVIVAVDLDPDRRGLVSARRGRVLLADRATRVGPRIISDCHFAVHLHHFIPGLLSYLVSDVFLK